MNIQAILTALPQIGVIAAAFTGSYFLYGWIADVKSEDVESLQNARNLRRQAYQRALDELSAGDVEVYPILADPDTAGTFRPQESVMPIQEWYFDARPIQS